MEEDLMELLDKIGLDEEHCRKSRRLYQMRVILIDKYLYGMSREETCIDLNDEISIGTYNNRLNEALLRLSVLKLDETCIFFKPIISRIELLLNRKGAPTKK
jgi:hypothetical protein